jgi:hypothetical protein
MAVYIHRSLPPEGPRVMRRIASRPGGGPVVTTPIQLGLDPLPGATVFVRCFARWSFRAAWLK